MNILYVDDERDIIDVARIYFQDQGILIDTALLATDAIELVKKKNYSVIVSDARMPEMDGLAFNQVLRNEVGYKGVFILVTGHYDFVDSRTFPPGIDRVLIKPIEFEELRQVIVNLNIKCD